MCDPILLIEDDPNKATRVMEELKALASTSIITHAKSYKSALKAIARTRFRFIVVDMTLPMFDANEADPSGYRVEHFGGKLLLAEMDRRGLRYPTVVLTQFDILGPPEERMTLNKLDLELRSKFADFYLGAIFYKASEQSWRSQLNDKLKSVFEGKADA